VGTLEDVGVVVMIIKAFVVARVVVVMVVSSGRGHAERTAGKGLLEDLVDGDVDGNVGEA
jgi:hypothetical protein